MVTAAAVTLAACNDSGTDPIDGSVFVIEVADEQFRILLDNQQKAAQARALIGSDAAMNINGEIARGDGGFNSGFSWHLRPNTVEFVDMTMELCDGRPSFVEENVDYYVDTVKRYCPWGIKVVQELLRQ